MPQIGWFEILIIVSIAIIVVGPKDFPLMLKKVGSWIGSAKRYFSDVQNQVTEITDVSIKEELKKNTEIMKCWSQWHTFRFYRAMCIFNLK